MKNILRLLIVVICLCTTANPLRAQWIKTNGLNGDNVRTFTISGTNLFAGTDSGVFLTTNNGTNWTAVNTGLANTVVRALAVSGNSLFAGTDGGVFLSTDNGTSWTAINTGLTNTAVSALAVSGTNLFTGTSGNGVFLSTNNGTSWTAASTGLPNTNIWCFAVSGTDLFVGTSGDGVFLSTNNGTSWAQVNTGLTNTWVPALAVSGTNLFAGTQAGNVFLSTNNGTSWTQVNTGLTNSTVLALAVSGTNLFAVNYGSVFLSTNNGTSWTQVNTGLTNIDVSTLAVSGTNLFAGTYGDGVWRRPLSEMISIPQSLIGTWTRVSGPGDPIRYSFLSDSKVVVIHNQTAPDTASYATFAIVSSALRGIDLSQAGVVAWRGVYQISSDSLSFQIEGYWYTGLPVTSTPTSFSTPTTYAKAPTEIKENEIRIPQSFSLLQNYPNPFNPATTISFTLPSRSFVSLEIFDALGRVVTTLVCEDLPAGNYSKHWNAANMSSGIYFYRLRAGVFTETKKLILMW